MNKKDLIRVIRKVVREEVKKEVKQIFIKENKKSKVITKPITEEKFKKPIRKKYKTKSDTHYTSNGSLNKVLNETVGLSNPNGNLTESDEYPTMGGKTYTTENMAEVLGYGDVGIVNNSERAREVGAAETFAKAGVNPQEVPESVSNALTRDYSNLMKVINKDN
jgi:hypothetical protein